jgi:glycosyltransferase involved in cell wall biosynthesis
MAAIKYLDSVSNLVVIQNPNSDPLPATNTMIKRVELQSRGVAKSRNAAIENTTTEYLLFGDDDIEFKEESINVALEYLQSNPDLSILLLQAVDETGKL